VAAQPVKGILQNTLPVIANRSRNDSRVLQDAFLLFHRMCPDIYFYTTQRLAQKVSLPYIL
jgi:hypothetical protein